MMLQVLGLAWLRWGYGVGEGVAHSVTVRGLGCAEIGFRYGAKGLA